MTFEKLVNFTIEVRTIQKQYFQTRNPKTLEECKAKERELDRQLAKAREDLQAAKKPAREHDERGWTPK